MGPAPDEFGANVTRPTCQALDAANEIGVDFPLHGSRVAQGNLADWSEMITSYNFFYLYYHDISR